MHLDDFFDDLDSGVLFGDLIVSSERGGELDQFSGQTVHTEMHVNHL